MTERSGRRRDVTAADVARLAGVGKATASRVLGGYGPVSDRNRQRVLDAAAQLGYRPNELARSMNTGRSRTIGVVIGDIENGFFSVVMRGISDAAKNEGYDVIVINTSERVDAEKDAIRVLLDKRVDALIIAPASAYQTEHLVDAQQTGRPLVFLDRRVDGLDVPSIEVDIAPAAAAATRALLEEGHRRVAFISALTTDGDRFTGFPVGVSSVRERLSGMIDAFTELGIDPPRDLFRFQASTLESTQVVIADLLALENPPTALVLSDGIITLNALHVLRERGIRIPDDVSLAAFDDLPWAAFTTPPLTVVAQPTYDVGVEAARTAISLIEDPESARPQRILAASLVQRDSIAAAATADAPA